MVTEFTVPSTPKSEATFRKHYQLARRMRHGGTNLVYLGGDRLRFPPRGLQPRVAADERFGEDWQLEHGRTERQFHLDGSPDIGVFLRPIPWCRSRQDGEGGLPARLSGRSRHGGRRRVS